MEIIQMKRNFFRFGLFSVRCATLLSAFFMFIGALRGEIVVSSPDTAAVMLDANGDVLAEFTTLNAALQDVTVAAFRFGLSSRST